MIFLVHQCDVKACKENLVVDSNFYNNAECCMANETDMISFMGRSERAAYECQNLAADFVFKNISAITKN